MTWGFGNHTVWIPWILPLGRECQVEIGSGVEPRPFFEHLSQILVSGTWIGRRLQNHQYSLAQVQCDRFACRDDVGDVRFAVLVQRRRNTDHHRPTLADFSEIATGSKSVDIEPDDRHPFATNLEA